MEHNHHHGANDSTTNVLDITMTTIAALPSTTIYSNAHHSEHHAIGEATPASQQQHHNMMMMFFHGGCKEVILFDWWRIESYTGLFFSCFVVFLLATGYESIKWFRIYYQMCYSSSGSADGSRPSRGNISLRMPLASLEDPLISQTTTTPTTSGSKTSAALKYQKGCNAEAGDCSSSEAHLFQSSPITHHNSVYMPTVIAPAPRPERSKIDQMRHSFKAGIGECAIKFSSCARAFEATLYGLQLVIAYFLMLIAMTYNVYLFAAVVAGATMGHWLFAGLKRLFVPSSSSASALKFADQADNFLSDACH